MKVPAGSGIRWRLEPPTCRAASGRGVRQCGSSSGLGSIMETKSEWNGTAHSGQGWRSKPSHRRGRDRLQQLVKNKQCEEHGTARLLLQCSGGVCREGYFLLPSMNRHRPRSQNTAKEGALIPEKDSKRKRPRSHVSLEKSSKNYKPLEK